MNNKTIYIGGDILDIPGLLSEYQESFNNKRYIARLIEKRAIPHRRLSSRRIQFSRQLIDAWLKSREVMPAPSKAEMAINHSFNNA